MKNSYKVAGLSATLLGLFALTISPVVQPPFPGDDGPGGNIAFQPPFPGDDGPGGNIVQPPFPGDDGPGGNIIAHGPFPFPDDSAGTNIVG